MSREQVPANESRADKFSRLATKRVNNALRSIRLIANLSTSQYEYSDEQVAKIENALLDVVNETMSRFNKARIETPGFTV